MASPLLEVKSIDCILEARILEARKKYEDYFFAHLICVEVGQQWSDNATGDVIEIIGFAFPGKIPKDVEPTYIVAGHRKAKTLQVLQTKKTSVVANMWGSPESCVTYVITKFVDDDPSVTSSREYTHAVYPLFNFVDYEHELPETQKKFRKGKCFTLVSDPGAATRRIKS